MPQGFKAIAAKQHGFLNSHHSFTFMKEAKAA
jgi:hypothetical protein